jgi:hypothetical protein
MAQSARLSDNVIISNPTYFTVAASQTGAGYTGGKTGDLISGILVMPAALAAGNIALLDGATSISVFVTGTLADLKPFWIPLGFRSINGAWTITTGASVSVIVVGAFAS